MVANVSFNPMVTTNAAGSFNVTSSGYIQGTALNDPSIRNQLAGGQLALTETLPMWGGVGISENIPSLATEGDYVNSRLGGQVGRATSLTQTAAGGLTGFSVFDQNNSAITTPQSPVPLVGSGMTFNFYRLGSGARIIVAADPALVSLDGGPIGAQVSWDFANQLLVPYLGTLTVNSGTYNSTTGIVSLTMAATPTYSAGDAVITTLTGTGSVASLNGTFTILSVVGSVITYQAATGLTLTITGGTLTLGSGASSALNVRVLEVVASNNMTVNYNAATGFATWNRSGSAAVILI